MSPILAKNTTEQDKEKPAVAVIEAPVKNDFETQAEKYPVLQTMSEEDAYIHDKMKSQPQTLDDVFMVKEKKYVPGEHRLSLPKEFKAYETRFAFRWINKKKRAVDDANIKGWVIVNRRLFPHVAEDAKHLFSTSGAVEKGDCILAFMNKDVALQIRKAPGERSSAFVKAQLSKGEEKLPKGKSGFYKPEDTFAREDAAIDAGGGLQEDRDF